VVGRAITTTHRLFGPLCGGGQAIVTNNTFQRLTGFTANEAEIAFNQLSAPIRLAVFRVVAIFGTTGQQIELASHTTDPAVRVQRAVISAPGGSNGSTVVTQEVDCTEALEALRLTKTAMNLTAGYKTLEGNTMTIFETTLALTQEV
jgi:hypothetical protein